MRQIVMELTQGVIEPEDILTIKAGGQLPTCFFGCWQEGRPGEAEKQPKNSQKRGAPQDLPTCFFSLKYPLNLSVTVIGLVLSG